MSTMGTMSDGRQVPTGLATARVIAAIAWTRTLRGRALWVGAVIAALPVVLAAALAGGAKRVNVADSVFLSEMLVLAVLPAMLVAPALGDEIEERTITYLWSRPVQRWAVVIGKLAALAPIAIVMQVASWVAAVQIGTGEPPAAASVIAMAVGALAVSTVAIGVAALVPRFGTPLAICYMLFDFWLGKIPGSIRRLSICDNIDVIAWGPDALEPTSLSTAVIGLIALTGVWLAIALGRMRRLEA